MKKASMRIKNLLVADKACQRREASEFPAIGDDGKPTTAPREKVTINVGGIPFTTFRSTLKQVPKTRLYYLMMTPVDRLHPDEYDPETNQYFFDRSSELFDSILNYYRTGQLHVPRDVCWPLFDLELKYWGLDHTHLETCCWMVYKQHTDNDNTLKALDAEDHADSHDPRVIGPDSSKYERTMVKLWALFDDPISSNFAKCLALFSLTTILLSVAIFCLETHEMFRIQNQNMTCDISKPPAVDCNYILATFTDLGDSIDQTSNCTAVVSNAVQLAKERRKAQDCAPSARPMQPIPEIFIIETCCVIWFTFEFIIRLISCPSKITFCKNWLNIVDFISILPYFFDLFLRSQASGILRVVRVARVFRVFKLTRHSVGLKILWHTLHASMKELLILGVFLFLGVVIFASLIYYAEKLSEDYFGVTNEDEKSPFVDIPVGFWWAIVTMTTLGYGDMVPATFAGQLIGSLCALCGLLTIALPVPVIVSNFSLYYSHYQAKVKLPKTAADGGLEQTVSDHPDSGGGGGAPESRIAIGSKHEGYVDPPFDEFRERMRLFPEQPLSVSEHDNSRETNTSSSSSSSSSRPQTPPSIEDDNRGLAEDERGDGGSHEESMGGINAFAASTPAHDTAAYPAFETTTDDTNV